MVGLFLARNLFQEKGKSYDPTCTACDWRKLEGKGWAAVRQLLDDLVLVYKKGRMLVLTMSHPASLFVLPKSMVCN